MAAIEPPQSAVEDLAFLSRSPHRVDVLTTLSAGDRTRTELHEETDIIQPTLGRVLSGFEDRGWVEREGSTYDLTPFGAVLADQFAEVAETVETMRRFREAAEWLPLEEFDFDLRRFGTATITTPTPTDALAHLRREEELADGARTLQHLCSSAYPPSIEAYRDRIVAGAQEFEAVITADALAAAKANPETSDLVRDIAMADNATIYRYDGPVSYQLGLVDDTAVIVPLDGAGVPQAVIESADDAIRDWVTAKLAEYRSEAVPFSD